MAGPFSRMRQKRADQRELGEGLWRQAHDRYARALHRYHQAVAAAAQSGALSAEQVAGVAHAGEHLEASLARVRQLTVGLQRQFPASQEHHIPARTSDVHRQLSRAAHELAATAQALTMFRLGQGSSVSVGRHAERTLEFVAQAEAAAQNL
ncbi:MAG: hypothetical protein Q4G34_09335 [Micrococcus sp.]|nr:hypothetical protein [Micrococcus sp.]